MLKLISINIEGRNHFETVLPFIASENPDCLCLQEAPEEFLLTLKNLGYKTSFSPMQYQTDANGNYVEGIIVASKKPFNFHIKSFYGNVLELSSDIVPTPKLSMHHPYIFAHVKDADGKIYNLVTCHIMVTKDGLADEYQTEGVYRLLELLQEEPDHIICGDFNMPRGYNHLYEKFTETYTDNIPAEYKSSLDKNIHRLGNRSNLNAPIFDIYMVDHLLSRGSQKISDVRLQFGVSDHAAVIASISQ